MKPFRTTVILLALLVLPLLATQALADFNANLYRVPDGVFVPEQLVSAITQDKAVIGFTINGEDGNTLDRVKIRSQIQRVYATERVEIWREDGTTAGFQKDEDEWLDGYYTGSIEFDINEEITILGINQPLGASETFYITLDINTGVVNADPDYYHQTGLEVAIEAGYIRLTNGEVNTNPVRNPGWLMCPPPAPPPYYCPFTLVFDTKGPYFDLHFCIEGNSCSTYAYYDIEPYIRPEMVDQEDTIRVCATNVEGDIDNNIGIHVIGKVRLLGYVSSMHMFGVGSIVLKDTDSEEDGCDDDCWSDYNTTFIIPDRRNAGQPGGLAGFWGVDADTGHWYVCAWAQDTVGNRDTICIGHEDLVYRIDTQKPIIDSVSWEFVTDVNDDGKIGLGDCIMIIGWGRSNPIEPLKECDKMEVDWGWYTGNLDPDGHDWIELDDVLENNRIFRKVFCFTDPAFIDSTDCAVNFLVRAWDNACNYDTLRDSLCGTIDLWPPELDVEYLWETDYDTMWACMSIGDQVLIRAWVGGDDIASVTAMMDSAGIDSLMQHAMPLFEGPPGIYDTIWTITKPPIKYGKDKDNSEPPDRDDDYRVWVTACDDVNNCVTVASNVLNKTLDTRRPRPIGYSCPDSVPCAIVATSQAGGIIELAWDWNCQENDGFAYYVWASYEGAPFDSIGMTDNTEQPAPPAIFTWHSEPLEAGYWEFKVQTEDNCSNVGPFSCVVGALADSTPPNACIVYPDVGRAFGSPFIIKALSEDADIDSVCLWYRLRHDLNDPPGDPGPWQECYVGDEGCGMYRPDEGYVFFDTIACLVDLDYVGWVEVLPTACDVIGNCQDTIRAYAEACIDDEEQNLVPGHFLFLWDPTRCQAQVLNVNGAASPQSMCGFDVRADTVNWVEINVLGATAADSFTIDVRALVDDEGHRILYRNNVTMPFIIDSISVQNWPAGTQQLFVYVQSQANDSACVPSPMEIDLCVPPQIGPCMRLVLPREWTRIPCSETESTCVQIWAELEENCPEEMVTQVKFKYSVNAPGPPWDFIDEVFYKDGDYWKTCWNNQGLVSHGDTVYLIAIGYNQFHVADTSEMVKVFVDCEAPNVKLIIEDVITTCQGIPKVSGEIILKADILDDTVDVYDLSFWFKLHSKPDLPANWTWMCGGEPAWYENIYMCIFDTDEHMDNNTWYDIRVGVADQAGNMWQDEDEDGMFDDSTFWEAVAANAGTTVFVDNEAPKPAISMVADPDAEIYNVNPSELLGGNGRAYVKAGDDVIPEISVLPSEDSCEVMKVEWFLCTFQEDDGPITSPPMGSPSSNGSGDDCEDPIVVNLPAALPFYQDDNTTCGKGNDYGYNVGQPTCLRPYDWGEDIIYKLNVTRPCWVDIILDPHKFSYMGMLLTDECPPTEESCIDKAYWWVITAPHGFNNVLLTPGTYYIMIDNFIAFPGWPNCSPDGFSLYIMGVEIEEMDCVHIGTSTDPYHYPITFNPLTDGLIPEYELEDGWWQGYLRAELYDSLGNRESDLVQLYILDVTPTQAVIVEPLNDSYVSGDVTLRVAALNAYEICEVCYEFRPEVDPDCPGDEDTCWYPVNGGYPNACTKDGDGFELVWHTLNTDIVDGVYYLRAVATDCSNNVDTIPRTIRVTVANGLPTATVYLDSTDMCFRECPDDPVDTLGFIAGTVTLYATASSDNIPLDRLIFMYKDIFAYPSHWDTIGIDYFPTGEIYSVDWNTLSGKVADGRYHLKVRAYNSAGRYGDSDPIEVSVDNSGPYTQIISIMGNHSPNDMDISKGDIIPIELVAIDSTSPEGWTRCYNSGVTKIAMCIAECPVMDGKPSGTTDPLTKCFEIDPFYDGDTIIYWNTSGLEFDGCRGCYQLYVKAWDCLGNVDTSAYVTVWVSDITAPITTIGGFDGNYIYGYSSEKVKNLLFEYADSGTTDWIPIGLSDSLHIESYEHGPSGSSCGYYLYKSSWNPDSLEDGVYQVRVISHDTCSNQADSMAPWAFIHVQGGIITPYNPDVLGALSFQKNWCVGGMHGIVHQTSTAGTPVVIARYNATYECVDMQHPQDPNDNQYAGSFFASDIEYGGPAKFFSSITVPALEEYQTGEPASITYLMTGNFDVVQVKRDVGTHGTYQDGCVEVTIPGGAVGGTFEYDRYIWVAPTAMPWPPVIQPDIKPIGDNNGYATYVSFTDCYYCCGFWRSPFGDDQGTNSGAGGESSDDCCLNIGRWAKIKMCYDTLVTTSKEHLAVMWWDCQAGKFKYDDIALDILGVEGFNTEQHYVEFATTCLNGPFAVVEILERPCEGTIVVSVKQQDIYPYFNGYTSTKPRLSGYIDDNHPEGTSWIDRSSIKFKLDLREPGDLITIYDGGQWADGFGSFPYSGYDTTSGIFRAGWSAGYYPYENPANPLAGGDHIATLTAQNKNHQTCTDTVNFMVDATPPVVLFEQKCLGIPPEFDIIIIDRESGVNRDSVFVRFDGKDLNPVQLASMWDNDTLHVKWPYSVSGGIREARVWNGDYTSHGPVDMVGNWSNALKQDYQVDATAPHISLVKNSYRFRRPVLFNVYDRGGCGLYKIMFDECTGLTGECTPAPEESLVYDPQTEILRYYPPASGAWIQATVKDSAHNTTWLDSIYCVEDYDPPMVSFVPGYNGKYVGTDPTIKFVVTDGVAGVDWESVNAEIDGCNNKCTFPWTEVLNHMENDTVTLSCPLSCNNSSNFWVYVYSDYRGGKGPADKADNHIRYTQQWQYWVDKAGPSITLKTSSDSLCYPPLEFEIKDSESGLATIYVYEDSSLVTEDTTLTPDPHIPYWWRYYPSAGVSRLDLVAVDSLGNETHYGMEIKDDCTPPTVAFGGGFVSCESPTVTIEVTDDASGVDWSSVYVDFYTSAYRLQTFYPESLANLRDGDVITVTGDGDLFNLSDGNLLDVVIYSYKTSGTGYNKGPTDSAGNWTDPMWIHKEYFVDCKGPAMSRLTKSYDSPVKVKVEDNRSGVDATSFVITENGVEVTSYSYDASTGVLSFTPTLGIKTQVHISASDNVGNIGFLPYHNYDNDTTGPSLFIVSKYDWDENTRYTTDVPVKIKIADAASGIDWNSLVLKVDGEEWDYYESESLIVEQDQGLVEYFPGAGRKQIVITITDNAGNISDPFIFWTEAGELFLTDVEHGPHNFPNPFDPRERSTTIIIGLSKSAEVTAKIYDFAGEFVRTLVRNKWVSPPGRLYWDGKTEDGETEVGNGTYLCHIKARDPETSKTVTAVIKITVLKEDK